MDQLWVEDQSVTEDESCDWGTGVGTFLVVYGM